MGNYQMNINHSTTKVAILALVFAINDGVDIEEDDTLMLCKDIMENFTTISLDYLKERVRRGFEIDKSLIREDAQTMTIAELSEKWHMTKDAVRSYCRRNQIKYKKELAYRRG